MKDRGKRLRKPKEVVAKAARAEKRVYLAPDLTKYGTIIDLTDSLGGGNPDLAFGGSSDLT